MNKKKNNLKALIVAILRIALRRTGSTSVHILIGFKVSCLVRSHEHCRDGTRRHVLNVNFKTQDLWKQKDNVLQIDLAKEFLWHPTACVTL